MKLSAKQAFIGIAILICPISMPKAEALTPERVIHYPARANFVPIKMFAKFLLHGSIKQFKCLDGIYTLESHWNSRAYNHTLSSGKHAGGIPQILGLSTKDSPYLQILAGHNYIKRRYGTACNALAFHHKFGWY